ncbi:MAG: discoidin domain-containing protein [Armatimonadetes bacterium]|nr:discoidin domain-containing protein [Armatimonadota bacterium]
MLAPFRVLVAAVSLAILAAAPGPAAEPFHPGLGTAAQPSLRAAVRQAWLTGTGCRMARLPVRLDVFAQPGGETVADSDVRAVVDSGATPLLALYTAARRRVSLADGTAAETAEPDGLFEPIFADGSDTAGRPPVNPTNRWAAMVHLLVERFDGDGQADAPGSPKVTWFSFGERLDQLTSWPGSGLDHLARLVAVGRAAARAASPDARLGLQLSAPESLEALLADRRHPVGTLLDFVDFPASAGAGSDGVCFDPGGLVPLTEGFRAVWRGHGYHQPQLLCSTIGVSGVPAEGRVQRAAVVKTQVTGATLGLVSVMWQALFDPSPASAALIRDVRPLPPDGAGWQPRDAYYAYVTFMRLLGYGLDDGSARLDEEMSVGTEARCYRFHAGARDLVVAWARDPVGEPERAVTVRLPLKPGQTYARYHWDYCLSGRPEASFDAGADGEVLTLGIDPVYFLSGDDPPHCDPVDRPPSPTPDRLRITASDAAPDAPPELARDGDPDSAWRGGARQRQPWWQVDFLDGPVTSDRVDVLAGRIPRAPFVVQVSDDGAVWRTVSSPVASGGFERLAVRLSARCSSAHWRVLFQNGVDANVSLFEIGFGDRDPRR